MIVRITFFFVKHKEVLWQFSCVPHEVNNFFNRVESWHFETLFYLALSTRIQLRNLQFVCCDHHHTKFINLAVASFPWRHEISCKLYWKSGNKCVWIERFFSLIAVIDPDWSVVASFCNVPEVLFNLVVVLVDCHLCVRFNPGRFTSFVNCKSIQAICVVWVKSFFNLPLFIFFYETLRPIEDSLDKI